MDGLPGAGCCHCCCSSDLRNSKNQHGKVSAQHCGDGAHTLASTERHGARHKKSTVRAKFTGTFDNPSRLCIHSSCTLRHST